MNIRFSAYFPRTSMTRVLIFAGLWMLPFTVNSGTAIGKVAGYIPYSAGDTEMILVKIENYIDAPQCNFTSRFTMLGSNPKFKSTNAIFLTALLNGSTVKVKGLGTCNNISNSEDLDYICFGDIACGW